MTKVAVKWIKRSLFGVIGLTLLILLLLLGLLFTNSGLNAVIWGAQKALPQLEVKGSEGALLPEFSLFDISYKSEELNIEAKSREITLAITPSCFLIPSVCVEQLKIDGLDFALTGLPPASEERPSESSEPLTEIRLPVPVYVRSLSLSDIDLDILGNKISWQTFTSQIEMSGSKLTIHPTIFEDVNVELAEVADKASESKDVANTDQTKPSITLPDVLIPLEVDLEKFDLYRFNVKGETPVIVNHLGLSTHVQGYAVNVKQLTLDTPQADIELKSEIELRDGYPLVLDASALVKQTELKGQNIVIRAEGSVAELQLDAQLMGVVEARLNGRIESLDPELPFDIELTAGHAQWPLTGVADYTVDVNHIKSNGSLKGYQLDIATIADGKGIPPLDLTVKGEGDLEHVELESILLKTLGGEVSGQVMANWQSPVNWQAKLGLSNIQPGLEWEQAEGVVNGSLTTTGELFDSGGWQVELPLLDIEGVIREYPLTIEGELLASDKKGTGDLKVMTSGLVVKHGPNGLNISGQLDKKWAMDTSINFPDIEKSLPDFKGSVNGQIALRGELKTPEIRTDLSAEKIAYLDIATISNITLSSDLAPLPAPSGELDLKVTNVVYENKTIDSIDLSFSGSQKKHQLSLDVLSDLLKANLHIAGGLHEKPELIWKGTLDKAELSTVQGPWGLDHPVAVSFLVDSQVANVQAHCWTQANSEVCLSKDLVAGQSGEVHLDVQNFVFSQLDMFIPKGTNIDGEFNAEAWASWGPNKKPDAEFKVSLPKGKLTQQIEQPIVLAWESIVLSAQLHKDSLAVDWLFDLADNGDIKGNLKVPDVQATHQGLDAQIILDNINLDMIQPLVGEYSKVNADINSDIRISGPVKHPKVNGKFIIGDIIAQGDIAPVEVNNGTIAIDFSGYDARLNADIETPDGVLQLDGDANWEDLSAWSTNVKVFAEELNVTLPPIVQVKIKPDMQIAITPKRAIIEGDIYLPWGNITVEELPPSAIGVSSDEVILNKNLQPEEGSTALPIEVETNVNIHIGDDFKLAAFGLKGELVGKLNVTQKDKGPFIVGEVEVVNGAYRSFGQDLIIVEGKVLMNGPPDQPYLAIDAVRNPDNTQDDVVAGIRVTGPANEPAIEVYSKPSMPQQNALSYLLRGQDLDGAAGGSSMTTALIGLSLAKSGQLVGQIGETFGVSDLQLDTAGSGEESQVTVSGYLTPELQVKYGVGIFDSFGEFTVRYKLVTDLYLEAVSGMDSAVDLLYQFEFD